VKIAFVLGQFPSLSETFVLNQITGMIDRGHQVSIFAERGPSGPETHPCVERYSLTHRTRYERLPPRPLDRFLSLHLAWKWDGPHLRALNVFHGGMQSASLRTLWATHLFDGARDFDIVQCHFGAHGVKAARLRRIGALRGKIVTAFHGDDIVCYPRRFHGNVYKPLFAEGDLFLPVSGRGKEALIAMGCPPERLRVHRMGVDMRRFPAPARRGAMARLKIVTVARLVAKKGIDDAIRAVAGLSIDYEYIVAGEGPLRSALEGVASASGAYVRFAGAVRQNEVAKLLESADIYLAPSVTASDGDIEGIPVSIMEAMAAGLPVVSTRHSAIPELVADGVSGFLAGERDIPGLARHLMALAEDPGLRARMGAAGREIVAREFAINELNAKLEGLYRELLYRQ
jgi:colanic acid/amylovoran biosynthesis glycosyltransferase